MTGTAGVTYTYDGDGKRVMKSSGTLYWYGLNSGPLMETTLTGTANYLYFFFNGRIVYRREFQHSGNVVDTYVLDQLGNTNIVSGYSGAWDQSTYYPFGGERVYAGNVGNHYKFTGKERDPESGLDNFAARFNSSSMGRFMSPDPGNAGASVNDPQSWNAYSYVENNPLNAIDPNGLYCAYLNDAGTGVDRKGIDNNSNSGECNENGGYWIQGEYGGGSWLSINADKGTVTGVGYDSSGNPEVSTAGAMDSNAWGAWTKTNPGIGGGNPSDFGDGPTWAFGKSFFTLAGGPGNKPTCAEKTLESISDEVLGTNLAGAPAGEAALKAVAAKQAARAAKYAAGRPNSLGGVGLICPRCSSVFRSMMFKSTAADFAAEAALPVEVGIAAGKSGLETAKQAREGECSAAVPFL